MIFCREVENLRCRLLNFWMIEFKIIYEPVCVLSAQADYKLLIVFGNSVPLSEKFDNTFPITTKSAY